MPAPTVQDINALVDQYKTALAPEKATIDTQIAANDTSGQQQVQGLDAAKTNAFQGITQTANDRGGYFSGFAPDAQAKYTGATYLPKLAELQNTIAATRSSLLGKKNELDTQANTSAIGTHNQQLSAFQQWQNEQDQLAAQAAEAEKNRQFQASENSKNRAASASAAASKAPTSNDYKSGLAQDLMTAFSSPQAKTPYYTEKVVLPALYAAYGPLGTGYINKTVYDTRRAMLGS